MKIDIHTHILPETWPDLERKFGYSGWISLEHHTKNSAKMMKNGKCFRVIECNCWDPLTRIEECSETNVDVQVLSTVPAMFNYWAKPADTLFVSKLINDHIGMVVDEHPKNFLGLGTLPMQDEKIAIKELERCIKDLGLVGIQIGSNVNGVNLNEKSIFSILEAARDLDASIFIHPWDIMGRDEMEKYWLPWLVGMPAETSRAICSMIFGGIFDKFPNLRVNFCHASGSFLSTIGRIEHGFNSRPDLVALENPKNPREYCGHFWVDCITHDQDMLHYVLKMQGSKRVTLGSDYPFPLGDLEIGEFINRMNLEKSVVEDIFCNSTLEWLNLKKEMFV